MAVFDYLRTRVKAEALIRKVFTFVDVNQLVSRLSSGIAGIRQSLKGWSRSIITRLSRSPQTLRPNAPPTLGLVWGQGEE